MFCGGHGETQGEMRFADAGRSEEHHILLALDEAEGVQALDLLAFDSGLKTEIEIAERLHRGQACGAHGRLQASRVAQLDVRA